MDNQYDVVYSLGVNCGCAEYLRKNYLRRYSGPLDWVISNDIYIPFETLLDEFKVFLDFSLLKTQTVTQSLNIPVLHTRNQYLFLHDFFKTETVQSQQHIVHEKYTRRVNRILTDLQGNKRILLCWYGENGTTLQQNKILYYITEIRNKYKAKIDFLFIMYTSMKDRMCLVKPAPGVLWYQLPARSLDRRTEGNLFWDSACVNQIFSSIVLINSKKTAWLMIRNIYYRILAAFIFNRTQRHKFIENKIKNN